MPLRPIRSALDPDCLVIPIRVSSTFSNYMRLADFVSDVRVGLSLPPNSDVLAREE